MNYIPIEILHIIYTFTGANAFYLNKQLLTFINKKRQYFYHNPITLKYRLIHSRYTSIISQKIINIKENKYRRSIKLSNNIDTVDVSNSIIGYYNDGFIMPYNNFKKKIIPKEYIESAENNYRISNNITFDIFKMWSDDENINKYMKLWV